MARRPSILEACVRKWGIHRGALRAAHIAQWIIATADTGSVPTIVEYAQYWAADERTGWRHAATCRELFGDDWRETVAQLASAVSGRLSQRDAAGLELPGTVALA